MEEKQHLSGSWKRLCGYFRFVQKEGTVSAELQKIGGGVIWDVSLCVSLQLKLANCSV